MPRRPDRTRLLLTAYAVGVFVILLMPTASLASAVVTHTASALDSLGVPPQLSLPVRVEFGLNALMVAPLTAALALARPGVRWTDWVAWTFVASCAVELVQGVLLPGRSAQAVDVVANTLGGLAGALIALALLSRRTSRTGSSTRLP